MRVTNDPSLLAELLWGSEVVGIRVYEGTSLKAMNSHLDCEISIFINCVNRKVKSLLMRSVQRDYFVVICDIRK